MREIAGDEGFDRSEFDAELAIAAHNERVGTTLLFENDRVRVWEVRLEPGERAPFHAHRRPYFWTVADGGVARQRTGDGTVRRWRYEPGDTRYFDHTPGRPMIHDLENVGPSVLRFVTVELLDQDGTSEVLEPHVE